MSVDRVEDEKYEPRTIEARWRETWDRAAVFRAVKDPAKAKYFVMEMFPYPSGRLHMGHVRNYTIGDVTARYMRMKGRAVMYPMGWDAFGLPAENAAIKAKVHPRGWTMQNIGHMREQFRLLGLSYDWDREFATCEPEYFVHEQRIFIEMFKRGLAYRKAALVNWCPVDQTVLANEQVEDGLCWRCRSVVQQRELEQWFLKVTAYADQLLADMGQLRWGDNVIRMQENWIGRSEGARLRFPIVGSDESIEVFTTRPDTLYGATFMSIAVEHPLVKRATAAARAFAERVAGEDKIKRTADDYEKEGADSGIRAINPVTGQEIPVWVANFVLMEYGTGAVMAVPAHDERDFQFATKYGLPKRIVIQPEGEKLDSSTMDVAYVGPGILVNSGEFDGLDNETAKAKITAKVGEPTVSYRIRDWLLSRQRYWGCPIPMVLCPTHGYQPVPDDELPVRLPDDVTLAEGARSPLAAHPTWSKTKCPVCGGPATRETDTMDGFMESSWYELRYCSPHTSQWLDQEQLKYWMPVDLYIGGTEQVTKHLIYARFFTKMLRDWSWIPKNIDEPFIRLVNQGMVVKETYRCPEHDWLLPDEEVRDGKCVHCGRDVEIGRSEKMSKNLRNVIEPLPLIEKYGADTVRVFSLFAAPPDSMLEWSDAGVEGAWRFLNRVYRMVEKHNGHFANGPSPELRQKTHATIKRVTEDIESFKFNTAIAAIMELVNTISTSTDVDREAVESVVRLLAPMAPHLCEELWQRLGHSEVEMLAVHAWPVFNPEFAAKKRINYPVQVNGKLRGQIEAEPEAAQAIVESAARESPSVAQHLAGKEVVKVVFVPGRLINFVVKG
jgi:leucyl-tRNA synthetase